MRRLARPAPLTRWRDYRRRQLEALRESNRFTLPEHADGVGTSGRAAAPAQWGNAAGGTPGTTGGLPGTTGGLPGTAAAPPKDSGALPGFDDLLADDEDPQSLEPGTPAALGTPGPLAAVGTPGPLAAAGPAAGSSHPSPTGASSEAARRLARDGSPYGTMGRPLNRRNPLFVGFVGALGALIAIGLWNSLGRLTTTFTILLVAFFLTLALNPLVEILARRGLARGRAVLVVFAGLVGIFVLLGIVVIPPAVTQGAALAQEAPSYVEQVLNSTVVRRLDSDYQVIDRVQEEVTERISDQTFVSTILGGIVGAGRALATGVFQTFTVLILVLYFLASLPRIKNAAYGMVPASRRTRVVSLSEEIMRRTGSYAIGQAAIATINAVLSWVMMTVVGIPYAAVLAVAVGFLGLIPMIGATLGAVLVCLVAVFSSPTNALIAAAYYIVYQQVENYVVAPRVMQRTVSVPGAVTVVAALAGGTLLGVLGALLAIPVAAGLLLLYEEVLLPRQLRV